jgi:hypothetical protein
MSQNNNRREFIKKSAYAAPAIISCAVLPVFATSGFTDVRSVLARVDDGSGLCR